MATKDPEWLSTGQAAKLCSVTPDTVLKWIRKGRLDGVRTAGGHFRIRREHLEAVMNLRQASPSAAPSPVPSCAAQPLRCWEYLSADGKIREECRDCVVYQVRATKCYQVAGMEQEVGHSRRFCRTSCEECPYYRRVQGLDTNVLAITSDKSLVRRLTEDEQPGINLRIAHNAYDAALMVDSFRPAFVMVDEDLCSAGQGGLLNSLARDRRVPGIRIILGVRDKSADDACWGSIEHDLIASMIEKPFGLRDIAKVIEKFPTERLASADGGRQPERKGVDHDRT